MAQTVVLGDIKIPALGYGTAQVNEEEMEKGLEAALEAGYRHIDTAYIYKTEATIGTVLKRWISSGKLKREDLFITTKLPPKGNRPEGVKKYLKKSLEALQLTYVDLYLIHAPFGFNDVEDVLFPKKEDGTADLDTSTDLIAIWKEMERQVDAGLARAIGVSNFNASQIRRILDVARIPPANLQNELHLYLQERELVEFCRKRDIVVTAYAPLGSPGQSPTIGNRVAKMEVEDILEHPVVQEIAEKHQKTTAQVLLRHVVQKGIAAVPKSSNPERIRQNIDIFDFVLDDEDVGRLDGLDRGEEGRLFRFLFFKGVEKHPEYAF